jgi:hypothetical protein
LLLRWLLLHGLLLHALPLYGLPLLSFSLPLHPSPSSVRVCPAARTVWQALAGLDLGVDAEPDQADHPEVAQALQRADAAAGSGREPAAGGPAARRGGGAQAGGAITQARVVIVSPPAC